MPADRGSAWIPGLPESAPTGQLPGPPPPFPSQMGPGNQPARQPAVIYAFLFSSIFQCYSC